MWGSVIAINVEYKITINICFLKVENRYLKIARESFHSSPLPGGFLSFIVQNGENSHGQRGLFIDKETPPPEKTRPPPRKNISFLEKIVH